MDPDPAADITGASGFAPSGAGSYDAHGQYSAQRRAQGQPLLHHRLPEVEVSLGGLTDGVLVVPIAEAEQRPCHADLCKERGQRLRRCDTVAYESA